METGQILLYAFLGLVLILWLRRRIQMSSIAQVSREAAEEQAESGEAVLIDVRTAVERSKKCISASLHIPMSDMTDVAAKLDRFREKQIIFYCATGSRSLSAALRAKKLGFQVGNLRGGIGF